jgi:protein-S-isoprenylcysteine O-methyltransferase Ste14
MPLKEEMEREGNWLFRRRSYLPLLMVVPILLAMRQMDPQDHAYEIKQSWALFCMGVSFLGLGVRIFTIGYTPFGTSGRNTVEQVAEEVNTRGIYSLVRHPLYVGNYLIWLGVSMFFMTWWLPVIFTLIYWIYYERIMIAEEEFLRRKFGDAYERWAEKTPAFVPNPRLWVRSTLSFSLRNVLKREYSGFFGIIAVFFVLEVAVQLAVEHEPIPVHWFVIFLSGLAVYFTLRTLKRNTTLLHVQGR